MISLMSREDWLSSEVLFWKSEAEATMSKQCKSLLSLCKRQQKELRRLKKINKLLMVCVVQQGKNGG